MDGFPREGREGGQRRRTDGATKPLPPARPKHPQGRRLPRGAAQDRAGSQTRPPRPAFSLRQRTAARIKETAPHMPGRPPKGVRQARPGGQDRPPAGEEPTGRAGRGPGAAEAAGEAAREGASPGTERPLGRRTGTRGKPTGITPPHHSRGAVPPRLRLRVGPKPDGKPGSRGEAPTRGRGKTGETHRLDHQRPSSGRGPETRPASHAREASDRPSFPKGRHTRERGRQHPPDPDPPAPRRGQVTGSLHNRGNAAGEEEARRLQQRHSTGSTRTRHARRLSPTRGAAETGPHGKGRTRRGGHGAHDGGRCAVSRETA